MIEKLSNEYIEEYGTTAEGRKKLKIINALERNFEKYGASYCPCKINRIDDNICPCKEYRETGKCICGLYLPHEAYDNTKSGDQS